MVGLALMILALWPLLFNLILLNSNSERPDMTFALPDRRGDVPPIETCQDALHSPCVESEMAGNCVASSTRHQCSNSM